MRRAYPFVMMRGGTSKGVFFNAADVPADRAQLEKVILDVFGSPDRRQIDGLGGADKLTSKAAIIGPPVIADTDVTYLYGHVGITVAEVDFNANCGNLLAAVGIYAIEEGIVPMVEGVTRVRIHNLNTDKAMAAEVPVRNGEIVLEGDLAIAGVPGTGAPIALDFSRTAGIQNRQAAPTRRTEVNHRCPRPRQDRGIRRRPSEPLGLRASLRPRYERHREPDGDRRR